MTTTGEIADFATDIDYGSLDSTVQDEIKKRVLDAIAIGAGAIGEEPVEILRESVRELDHDGDTSIWGSDQRTSPPLAAALNGGMVRYLDFMDAFLLPGEVPHPSNNVAPAIVAGEYVDAGGDEALTAIGIAYEIHYQLARNAPLMDRGWDHGTYVTFASAAAGGKLFALDREAFRNALGISGVAHNALRVTRTGDISMWKGLSASNAARNAIYSVILASNGMEGPVDVFEGKKGWKEIVAGEFDAAYSPCEAVLETMTKKYMAGTVAQTSLAALDELMTAESFDGTDIDSVEVDTYHRAKIIMGGTGKENEAGDRYDVKNREEADHSLPYTLAVLALDGELGVEQYQQDRIRAADVQDLLRRIEIREDPSLTERYENGEMPARVRVHLEDGTTHELEKAYFSGHPETPMDWEELIEKFRFLADGVYTDHEQDAIVDVVRTLDDRDVSELTTILNSS